MKSPLSSTWLRIAFSYTTIVLLTGAVLASLLGSEFEKSAEDALRSRLTDQVRATAYSAAPLFASGAPVASTNQLAHDLARLYGTRVTLIEPDGRVVGDSDQDLALIQNHANRPEVIQALAHPGSPGTDARLSETVNRRLLYVALTISDPAQPNRIMGVARVAYPLSAVEQTSSTLFLNVALAVLLVSLPAALLSLLLARSIAGPISTLGRAARRFGSGDLGVRVKTGTSVDGEIGGLIHDFNLMADQLSSTITERTAERNQTLAILDHMHDGIIVTDNEGRIQIINPAAVRLLGLQDSRTYGRSLIEVTHRHELHQALRAALGGQPENQDQALTLETGGRTVEVIATAVPMQENGQSSGLIVLHDLTQIRRLEQVRREFIANIGHELRTPLASAKLLVETVSTLLREDPETAEEFLGRIDVELDGLTQMVRELLELSRIESGQVTLNIESRSVPTLLEQAAKRLSPQAERAGITIHVELPPGAGALPQVMVDTQRIQGVLINLIHNAIKFTGPGGMITVGAAPHGSSVMISVKDTGRGIPPEDLPRIFERFYKVDKARTSESERAGGTGLGLAIAKHTIQAHGGKIWAESVLGQGTTVFFTLSQSPVNSPPPFSQPH